MDDSNRVFSAGAAIVMAVSVIVLGTVIVVAAMWTFGWSAFQRSTAEERGETAQIERVEADPDYRIAAYEKFFDLCASVQADEETLANLRAELADDPTAERESQIRTTITAVSSNRAETIATYNADAGKLDTMARFKSSELPHRLDVNAKETTCRTEK